MIFSPSTTASAQPVSQGHVLRLTALAFVTLLVTSVMMMFGQTQAHAHDVLVEQTPTPGEILDTAPSEIRLSFNNELLDAGEGTTIIQVTDQSGQAVELGVPQVIARDAVLPTAELPEGAYRTVWSVVSSDGHRIAGEFTFGVGQVTEADLAALPAADSAAVDTLADGDAAENDTADNAAIEPGNQASLGTPAVIALSALGLAVVVVAGVMIWRKSKRSL